jgi:hypothetical protein
LDRRHVFSHGSINIGHRPLKGVDQVQMDLQQPSMVIADTTAQSLDELGALLASGPASQAGEFLRIALPGDERL